MDDRFKQIVNEPLILGLLLAFWGGIVRSIKCKREEFTFWGFLFRVSAAGFVSILTGLVLQHADYPVWIEAAIIGISGYSAPDILPILSDGFKSAVTLLKKIKVERK